MQEEQTARQRPHIIRASQAAAVMEAMTVHGSTVTTPPSSEPICGEALHSSYPQSEGRTRRHFYLLHYLYRLSSPLVWLTVTFAIQTRATATTHSANPVAQSAAKMKSTPVAFAIGASTTTTTKRPDQARSIAAAVASTTPAAHSTAAAKLPKRPAILDMVSPPFSLPICCCFFNPFMEPLAPSSLAPMR